jgi:hypothetical protein
VHSIHHLAYQLSCAEAASGCPAGKNKRRMLFGKKHAPEVVGKLFGAIYKLNAIYKLKLKLK